MVRQIHLNPKTASIKKEGNFTPPSFFGQLSSLNQVLNLTHLEEGTIAKLAYATSILQSGVCLVNAMLIKSRVITEVQACLWLAVPLVAAQLAQAMTTFVDTVMMGWLGSSIIAAGGLGSVTFTFCLLVGTSIVSAVSPLVAEAHGATKIERIGQIVRQGLWLALLLGFPVSILIWHADKLLLLLGQDANTVALTTAYLRAIAWGFVPGLGFAVLRSFVSALSQPRSIMVTVMLGTLLNIIGNYVLMFGKFGFPELGLAGIGYSSAFSFWSMFVGMAIYILSQSRFQTYQLIPQRRSHGNQDNHHIFEEIIKVGLPIGGLIAVEAGLFTVVTFLIGQLGTTALATHQIALQTIALFFQIALGISLATTVRVGQFLGQKNAAGMRLAGYVGMALGGFSLGMVGLLFWLLPNSITALFLDIQNPDNAHVVALVAQLLRVAAIFQIVDGIQVTAAGALRGLQDTRVPLLIGIVAYWCVGLPSGYLLGLRLGYGAIGLWWGLAVGLAIAATILTWRFSQLVNRKQAIAPIR
jgi:MATE family multidrug resistance protein